MRHSLRKKRIGEDEQSEKAVSIPVLKHFFGGA